MKKYITLAALLAAGTAFAGAAETIITLTDLTKDYSGNVSYSAETGCLSGSSLFELKKDGETSRYVASTTINIDLTALGISESNLTYNGSTILLDYRTDADVTTGAIGLIATGSGIQLAWQDSVYSNTSAWSITWSTLLNDAYVAENRSYVSLTLESSMRDGNKGGTAVYNKSGTGYVGTNSTNGNTGALAWANLKSDKEYDVIYVASSYVTGVSVYSGIASETQMSAASEALVVPEPSAFGMLAGLGALALVASRRRRK